MEKRFENEVAIITGAATGIGLAIAVGLAKEGAKLILNDVNESQCLAEAKKINKTANNCIPFAGDASEITIIEAMVELAITKFGRLDIVIANAGITTYGSFLDYTPQQFQQLIDLNLKGSFFLAQAAAKKMKQQAGGGRILFMSSVTGHQAHPFLVAYGMTKAALQMLAKGLVCELASHGITTNAISPGATLTERTIQSDPDFEQVWNTITPNQRSATVEDITQAALFLVSKASQHITGQTLVIDGGWISVSPSPDLEIPDQSN